MKGSRAAIRYAKALMQLAKEKNALQTIISDIKLIESTVGSSKELKNLLLSPLVNSEKKQSILDSIFGSKIDALTKSFIHQLVVQKRESILHLICEQFVVIYNEMHKIAKVELKTATSLNEATKTKILQTIKSTYQLSEIELTESVDTELIGGLVLRIGDKQLDASIKGQLKNIENELVQA